jgi:hypothetical protein
MTARYAALYQATLAQAAQAGEAIMGNALATARQALKERLGLVRGLVERDQLELTIKLLDSHAWSLCEQYPKVLSESFQKASLAAKGGQEDGRPLDRMALLSSMNFDQLELMDSDQVHERVALARLQQEVMLAAEVALAELNTYICTALGMSTVKAESNPLRSEVFVQALQSLLTRTQVPAAIQLEWLQHMGKGLGKELALLYRTLSIQLQAQDVKAAGYAPTASYAAVGRSPVNRSEPLAQATSSPMASNPAGKAVREQDETVLTLDRLRRLLVGELAPSSLDSVVASFAAQFEREFEIESRDGPSTDFHSTVPAALEALQEMKQVDHLVKRLDQRRQSTTEGDSGQATGQNSRAALRDQLRRAASGLGQALSLEVVSLMVDNMALDARVLEPIKVVIKNLEPALLKLALVDPRFFSDKQHPARRLLEEITQRSLAFENPDVPGLTEFLAPLNMTVGALAGMPIEDGGVFEEALQQLVQVWDARTQQKSPKLVLAVQALQHAEERSLLAEKVASEIRAKPAANDVDEGVLAFLCGPWAQVVAHAQMADTTGAIDPGQYRELIVPLLWSAQPEKTRGNVAKLTRLVPKLLAKMREGLHLIDYPSLKTSKFFELLMNLQQQAFRPQAIPAALQKTAGLHPSLFEADDPWLAPDEAKASGFMDMSDDITPPPVLMSDSLLPETEAVQAEEEAYSPVVLTTAIDLPVGAWVEFMVNDAWVRTQLSWASPHGTLFLFTSAYGSTQSMTKRSRDKMIANGGMRIVSGQPVVQGALDAVVQVAMLNSLDFKP